MTQPLRLARFSLGLGLVALSACVEGQLPAPPYGSAAAYEQAASASTDAATTIEVWRRALDRGGDAKAARAALAPLAADASLAAEVRDEARYALALAHVALGEKEPAARLLEDLLAAHDADRQWALEPEVSRSLSLLLTGKEPPAGAASAVETGPIAPFARALTKYFPLEENPTRREALPILRLELQMFGGSNEVTDRLGTFNVRGAHVEQRRRACSLCQEGVRSDVHSGRSGSWLGLPAAGDKLDHALVVVYADLENLVPERYAEWLPMERDELVRALEDGKGVVAAKERPGAPPVVLIAAPRAGLLESSEEALAELAALPQEPVFVDLSESLRPKEIQGVVRASFGKQRACYEALLARSPKAAGRYEMHFAIEDGKVLDLRFASKSLDLDGAFETCATDAFSKLTFPKAKGRTTVTYPIEVSP